MVGAASASAREQGFTSVEFRRRHLHDTGLDDASVDFMISNCAINHAPDKDAVYRETFRFLKPGGRFVVSDIYATSEVPADFAERSRRGRRSAGAGPSPAMRTWRRLSRPVSRRWKCSRRVSPTPREKIEVCSFTIRGRKPAHT